MHRRRNGASCVLLPAQTPVNAFEGRLDMSNLRSRDICVQLLLLHLSLSVAATPALAAALASRSLE